MALSYIILKFNWNRESCTAVIAHVSVLALVEIN